MQNRSRSSLSRGSALLGTLVATSALAQQAPNAGTASGALDDIIVTAEKRDESIQKVPISIVAYSAETLAEMGVDDFASLAARIPGVTLNSAGPGQSSYSIRGIASVGGNAPTTGFYIDETPILPSGGDGATATIEPDLFDLARVEVLRGPQGTLYGASSMGGTIRLITARSRSMGRRITSNGAMCSRAKRCPAPIRSPRTPARPRCTAPSSKCKDKSEVMCS
jgi:iron complex outermembrane receptor protein